MMRNRILFLWPVLVALLVLGAYESWGQEEAPPKSGGSLIFLRDYGTDDIGYLVVPEAQPQAGVVVLPDRYGVTPAFKAFCEALAAQGYLVLGVDLYNGSIAKNEAEAAQMATYLVEEHFNKTVKTGVHFFNSSPRFQMEKKILVSWAETGELTLKLLDKEKKLFSAVVWVDPTSVPEAELFLTQRQPLQVLLPATSGLVSEFRLLQANWVERSREDLELKVLDATKTAPDYLPFFKPFIDKSLVQPSKKSLLEKIF
jgi:dienelactone hydrolase